MIEEPRISEIRAALASYYDVDADDFTSNELDDARRALDGIRAIVDREPAKAAGNCVGRLCAYERALTEETPLAEYQIPPLYGRDLQALANLVDREAPAPRVTAAKAFEVAAGVIACTSRDFSIRHADALAWALLVGWCCEERHAHDEICGGDEAFDEVARRFCWDEELTASIQAARAQIREAS